MTGRSRGLYEVLITEALQQALATASLHPEFGPLSAAEAADRIALHLSHVIARAVAAVDEDERVAVGIELAGRLVAGIDEVVAEAGARSEALVKPGLILRALLGRLPDGSTETLQTPLIPLL